MSKIVTLTLNPALDVAVEVDAVVPDDKLRASEPIFDPGGGGINAARVITRLSGETVALFPAGGPSGALLRQRLENEGIAIECVPTELPTRQNFSAFERQGGRQFRFVLPGARLSETDLSSILDRLDYLLPGADYLVASGSLPPGAPVSLYATIAKLSGQRGAKFILDTSGEALKEALDAGVYAIKPNGKEFAELARLYGMEPTAASDGSLEQFLLKRGAVKAVALTLGPKGGVLTTSEIKIRLTPPELEPKSSVGAGDSFLGGWVTGLTRGYDEKKSFAFGMAAAAATMLTPGTELCTAEDTDRFFEELLKK